MNKLKFLPLAWVVAGLIAAADAQTSSTNSLVRFRLSYGTTFFGDLDVELFDHDKPLTVSNFLANVQNDVYDRSILHDLRPGFLLQGGAVAVPNPYSSGPFELITRVPTNAPVPNEIGVGTARPNVFGTLAMAKSPGTTNSSSSAWLFNLGNNADGFGVTNLDAIDGGYTVFGRVLTGSNVLAYLNTFTPAGGIQNMTNDFHVNFCPPLYLYPDGAYVGFDSIPVGYFGLDCIRFSDLFTVQILMLNGPDLVPPKVNILFPPSNPGVEGDVVPVVGTATDNVGVETVRVFLGTNEPVTASGTEAWSSLLPNVAPGTNQVVVEAIDAAGNRAQAARTFFRSVPVPFGLTIVGRGTVTGPANGALLDLTRGYTLTAKPSPGWLFAGWTGSIYQGSATLPFLMESNLNLTAVFVTNPFPAVKGSYHGLVFNDTTVEQRSSGFLTFTLGDLGAYSARLLMNGRTFRFSGHLSTTGGETNLISRTGTNELLIRLLVDLAGSGHVSGSLTNNQIASIDTNASWSASIVADRAIFSKTNPTPLAGSYTAIIPADAAGPDGDGYARVTVNANGVVSFLGTLADGTKAVQKAPISATGNYPLYLSLYKGQGALLSWITFDDTQPTTDLSGLLSWFKQAQTAQFYPGGFSNQVALVGSRYTPPASGAKVLPLTAATVGFTDGNLAANFANNVTLGADNKIANNSPNALSMTLQTASGLFKGTVTPPGGGASRTFRGALLQKQTRGAGFLLGTDQTSEVRFE